MSRVCFSLLPACRLALARFQDCCCHCSALWLWLLQAAHHLEGQTRLPPVPFWRSWLVTSPAGSRAAQSCPLPAASFCKFELHSKASHHARPPAVPFPVPYLSVVHLH
ncbi:uncharacterized protein B0H64DRAFT_133548 [Chaetomium fimeti]|uniref:Secreted protein n=1 Tax=Chaetomium fimeti TaxID=1854472 RepID=A0AAE0HKH2_9PEZI|nr:hypothetical protein B0H64DRAFT_133548 [Chaetomium fimeti]